ncbi:MAG: Mur ligase family protein [Gemmatimonadota bacterium]
MQLTLEDSRRLTGPNLVSPGPGAVLDVRVEIDDPAAGSAGRGTTVAETAVAAAANRLIAAWTRRARRILEAVGWPDETLHTRTHRTGATLVMSAPVDALYAATEVNEWALATALEAVAAGGLVADRTGALDLAETESLEAAAERLRAVIAAESNPALLRLQAAAADRGVLFLSDDDEASVGMGAGSRRWPVDDLPEPGDVPWDRVYDIPAVLVTGTNGKTTTVRLLAAMVEASGRIPGFTSTDGIFVGSELRDGGDWSGPGGARTLLRDPEVEVAILETARGGMLRRGLAIPRADGVVVTNVGVDHLGEYGLHDVEDIADAKLVVARAVEGGGRCVLNADDPVLALRSAPRGATPAWFARRPDAGPVPAHLSAGGEAVVVEDGAFVRRRGAERTRILAVGEAPITLRGAAVHNVENVMAALALAPALDVPDAAAGRALAEFRPTAEQLPGRSNLFRFGEATVLVDYVHNPHGMAAMAETVLALPARRRLVVIGQAGDRDDDAIRELARSVFRMRPDCVVVKELTRYLRGREPGDVPRLIRAELEKADADVEVIDGGGELEAVRRALEWCADGDLVVLPIQATREEVVRLLTTLAESGWRPGDELPDAPN